MSLAALGCNPDLRYSPPAEDESLNIGFEPGTIGYSKSGQMCVFVQADGAIGANKLVEIKAGFQADMGDSADIVHGSRLGASTAAFADNEYGWLVIWGEASLTAGGAIGAGVPLTLDTAEEGDVIAATAATPEILGLHANAAINDNAVGVCTLTFPVNRA